MALLNAGFLLPEAMCCKQAQASAQPAHTQPDATHAHGPLARIVGLAMSVWLWIKHHMEKLLGQSSSKDSSVSPSSA